jgi:EAL domain-containing protein (putative c-di-GMP-specific phosphodiesterase class I)
MGVHQIKIAIDDVCNEHSMLATMVLERVDFIKLVRALIAYGKSSNKKIILEGVENQQDLAFAKKLNVDYVQGFLYKPQFVNIRT